MFLHFREVSHFASASQIASSDSEQSSGLVPTIIYDVSKIVKIINLFTINLIFSEVVAVAQRRRVHDVGKSSFIYIWRAVPLHPRVSQNEQLGSPRDSYQKAYTQRNNREKDPGTNPHPQALNASFPRSSAAIFSVSACRSLFVTASSPAISSSCRGLINEDEVNPGAMILIGLFSAVRRW